MDENISESEQAIVIEISRESKEGKEKKHRVAHGLLIPPMIL
jgi:hypothetical protein